MSEVVLSLFPGLDFLGDAFARLGCCVVEARDAVLGGDVRRFMGRPGRFDGIVGGSPCQDFSVLNRQPESGYGREMLGEFLRIVDESRPEWWLLENVPGVPDVFLDGYTVQRLQLTDAECGGVTLRSRHVQFGHRSGWIIRPTRREASKDLVAAADGTSGGVSWAEQCRRQGLAEPLLLPGLTKTLRYQMVGNAVPVRMAETLAAAVASRSPMTERDCPCRCGRLLSGDRQAATDACRQRLSRGRRNGRISVTRPVTQRARGYHGGKGGVWKTIVNEMPPHDIYVEGCLGAGAVMRGKRPARASIGIESDGDVIREHWSGFDGVADLRIVHGDVKMWVREAFGLGVVPGVSTCLCCGARLESDLVAPLELAAVDRRCPGCGRLVLCYFDPPYLMQTRRSKKERYRHEWTPADHYEFLLALKRLPCCVMVSGYESDLYRHFLSEWRLVTYLATTRGGSKALEHLWCNFAAPDRLHDPRWVGGDRRERERLRGRADTIARGLAGMTEHERQYVLDRVTRNPAGYSDA